MTHTKVRFYFDPLCPWSWRTSLWMREAAKIRPLTIEWQPFSLEISNYGLDHIQQEFRSGLAYRVIELMRREKVDDLNSTIDNLYLALGHAAHAREENIGEESITRAALREAGIEENWLDRALADPSTLEAVITTHTSSQSAQVFGVPTLVLEHPTIDYRTTGAFGPVITEVPTGESAGELWDLVEGMIQRPEFFELKIPR